MGFDPHKVLSFSHIPCAPAHLGWTLLDYDIDKGWIRAGFTAKPEFTNLTGMVQGGFLTAMLDDTLGSSVAIKTKGEKFISTIELTTHFLRPVKVGPITCEATAVKVGRSIAFMEGQLFDEDQTLCARASSCAKLIPALQ